MTARATPDAMKVTQTLCQHPRPRLNWHRSVSTQHAVSSAKDDAHRRSPVTRESRRKTADRHLFLDILNANASKRDVKSYLANFKPAPRSKFLHPDRTESSGTSIGPNAVLAGPASASTASTPNKGDRHTPSTQASVVDEWTESVRMAIVLLKLDRTLHEDTLRSLGRTLSQLARLGMSPIVVVQCSLNSQSPRHWRDEVRKQMVRVVAAIETEEGQRAQVVEDGLVLDNARSITQNHGGFRGDVRLGNQRKILNPIERGSIPVIAPLSFNPKKGRLDVVASSKVVMALVEDFTTMPERNDEFGSEKQVRIPLDRLIILDSHGGLPRSSHGSGSHVFVNLEQEYNDICAEVEAYGLPKDAAASHLENIQLANDVLTLLPSTSSAVISSHTSAAAGSARDSPSGARNPLIHNLLTDKPLFSSSLPQSRLTTSNVSKASPPTLLKRGMPVAIYPSPRKQPWTPPSTSSPHFSRWDPALDLTRLTALIEDSFGRLLDADTYFARIAPVLAGIVVAGAYEGCAILTWEPVPGSPAAEPVPYLDKLAVRRASQGAGGVADILFNAMVRDCFPHGVVWRSRSVNPVNGWYFERAHGSWRLPEQVDGTDWTMFWTTENIDSKRFEHYAGVCGSLGSFWRDGKGAE